MKIQNCNFETKALREDKKLIYAHNVENLEILTNTIKELGHVFQVENVNGFRFNYNTVINSLTETGMLDGKIKYFEICGNTISCNSYFYAATSAPAFLLQGPGNAFGKISDSVLYKKPIFSTLGAFTGNCTGLVQRVRIHH